MALLLLDRADLEVKSEGETLALYEAGQRRGTVPVALIDRCVIHGGRTRLDSGVLQKLADAGAVTVLFSPRRQRRFALVLGPLHNEASIRLAQARNVNEMGWCRHWANALVLAKMKRQLRTLDWLMQQRPDARKALWDARRTVQPLLHGLLPTAAPAETGAEQQQRQQPPTLESLRGREGAAARAYFAGLSSVFAPALAFSGRNRRPPRDPVNACLSLGYTLLHAQAAQACLTAGLDPLLGFYHRPAFGRESLASDLIEPLRPAVDAWVWQLFRSQTLRADQFSHDNGACLLNKAGRQQFYAGWESRQKPWQRWLQREARLLARELRSEGQALLETPVDDEDEAC